MKRNLKLACNVAFGLREGRLYEPRQVPIGKLCGCVCPGCNKPLLSKHCLNDIVSPHFAHQTGEGCVFGSESAIHLAAKQLIYDHQKIYLPSLIVRRFEIDALGEEHLFEKPIITCGIRNLISVRLEESLSNFRPDIIATTLNDKEIAIEIAFTHFIDETKQAKIEKKGIRTIQIDVSELVQPDFESLSKILFEPSNKIEWVFHPKTKPIELSISEKLDAILKEAKIEAEKKIKNEEAKRRLLEAEKKDAELRRKLIIQKKREEFRSMNVQQKLEFSLNWLGINEQEIPYFLDYKVDGEWAFKVPRRNWQLSIFGAFIQTKRKSFSSKTIKLSTIAEWLEDRFEIKINPDFPNSHKVAIWNFLQNLCDLDILAHIGRQRFLVKENDLRKLIQLHPSPPSSSENIRLGDLQLIWSAKWPDKVNAAAIGSKYEKKYVGMGVWNTVINLEPEARKRTPREIAKYYATKTKGSEDLLLKYLIEAGFVEIAK